MEGVHELVKMQQESSVGSVSTSRIPVDSKCSYCGHVVTIPFRWKNCGNIVDFHCSVTEIFGETMYLSKRNCDEIRPLFEQKLDGRCPNYNREGHPESCGKLESVKFDIEQPINRFRLQVNKKFPAKDFGINPDVERNDPRKVYFVTNYLTKLFAHTCGRVAPIRASYNAGEPFLGMDVIPGAVQFHNPFATGIDAARYGTTQPLTNPHQPKREDLKELDEQGREIDIYLGEAFNRLAAMQPNGLCSKEPPPLDYSDEALEVRDNFIGKPFYDTPEIECCCNLL